MNSLKLPLSKKLQLILRYLEQGHVIKLTSGHQICIPEGHEEPGCLMKSHSMRDNEPEEEVVVWVGSADVWKMLVDHAKYISDEDLSLISANTVLNDLKTRKAL